MKLALLLAGLTLVLHQSEAGQCPLAPRNSLNGAIRSKKEQKCDPCAQIFEPGSSFMQNCGAGLTPFIKHALRVKCDRTPDDEVDDFLDYLSSSFCAFDPPNEDCECDICELLFDSDSDFMKNCAFDLKQSILDQLRYKCEKMDCSTHGLIFLEKFLAYYCASLNRDFEFPTCECNECVMFFEADSDFMQNCGQFLPEETREKLFETCSVCMDNVNALFTFFTTVRTDCLANGYDDFSLPICDCTDFCWHLIDPVRSFYKDCFSLFPFSKRLKLFKKCRAAHQHAFTRELFVAYLEYECYALTGDDINVPRDCLNCTDKVLDIVFVVDNSGSINSTERADLRVFLNALVGSFDIDNDLTRIGLIIYGDNVSVVQSLSERNTPTQVSDDINNYGDCSSVGCSRTNTKAGILQMIEDFANNNDGNHRIGMVITDGQSNPRDDAALQAAVDLIPDSIDMFAIGVAIVDTVELDIIARNKPNRRHNVADHIKLSGIIDDIRTELCEENP